jgi:histidinol-phosphate/aromatic aminotransferase/cobyric acid decarboxylase-like protein
MNLYDYAEEKHIPLRRLLDLTLCTNPLGPSNKARTAMRKVVREVGVFPDDKERFLRRFLSRKTKIPEDSFLFGHGSSHILSLCLQTFKPESVRVFRPFSRHHASLLGRLGIRCEEMPLVYGKNGFVVDSKALLSQASTGGTMLLMNPQDPSGATIPFDVMDELMDAFDRCGGMLIVDEAFIEYTELTSAADRAVRSSSCLVLRSLSLFHALAGLRIGYGIGHPSLMAHLASSSAAGPVNSMALAAARASLGDAQYYRRTREYIATEKSYALGKLRGLTGLAAHDTPCNFILVGLEESNRDVAGMLLSRGIVVDALQETEGKLWMRVPMRRRPQNARFVKTLRYLLSHG